MKNVAKKLDDKITSLIAEYGPRRSWVQLRPYRELIEFIEEIQNNEEYIGVGWHHELFAMRKKLWVELENSLSSAEKEEFRMRNTSKIATLKIKLEVYQEVKKFIIDDQKPLNERQSLIHSDIKRSIRQKIIDLEAQINKIEYVEVYARGEKSAMLSMYAYTTNKKPSEGVCIQNDIYRGYLYALRDMQKFLQGYLPYLKIDVVDLR